MLLAGLLLAAAPETARAEPVAVIVAAGTPLPGVDTDELAQVYRRRKLFLGANRVQPINLPANHPLRRWFSQNVLKQTPEEQGPSATSVRASSIAA
jgi:hypothetical protein